MSDPTSPGRRIDLPAATINQEFVCLYWHLGQLIAEQQEQAQ